ncbi:aldehyde dehydrogenase family protein [Alteraurantiacibacter buctensis]|uniref:Aldehyde dehydrogenase family protein n=1 Tax=Alteraurantiacibacter buctensis TaxID=1503981 RepID=A0A844Z0J3_9SPHN|nr:aldehyde dehydrogenase family protein [Alteraurantiacibacter buctensis]MXO73022.1 aldehyde dehydrogenase family protein [Alteraurantiacibacter buctensis]
MYQLLIDGQLVDGARQLDVVNPATGAVFATCARADEAQLEQAVAAAKKAFPTWATTPFAQRSKMLLQWADVIEARADEFARLLTQEQGKPLPQAAHEMGGAIAVLRTFANMELKPEVLRDDGDCRIIRQWTPLGVVAAITPWNFPMLLLMMKLAPGLSSGNTMVAKPAPTTPLTTLLLGETAADILPAGVLNVIVDQNDLGARLTSHPDIAKVSFTGSTGTGKRVMQAAADTLKRITLELGGNDAALVLDDADIGVVAPAIFQAATINAGQVCLAAKRVYAPRSLYEPLCDALAQLATDAVVDDGAKQGTQIGPIQNRAQFEKLKEFLADAHANGSVIAGGAPLDREGFFIAPTIVKDIPDSARLVQEEQFGPVLPILAYDDLDDAIARANDSEYGLGGTIWTSNPERAIEVAMKIDTGTVWINKHLDLPFDVPFGGAKQSGFGAEMGREGLEEFNQSKIVNVAL